jgi:hypothetical protein
LKIKIILAHVAGLAVVAAPGLAAAARSGFEPQAQESRIGVELDWLNTESSLGYHTNIATWDLTVQIGVTDKVFIDADIPWAYVDPAPFPDRGYFGNPWVGVHYARSTSENMSFYAGGALGLPVNSSQDSVGYSALTLVNTARAYEGRARFAPRAMPVLGRFGIELDYAPLFMRFDVAPTLFLPLRGGPSTQLTVDHAFEIGGRGRSGFLGGARLQGNLILTDVPDHLQFAIEPFFGYEANGPGLFFRVGLLVALDDDLGFGFDAGKIRTFRFAIGGKF